MRKSLSLKDDDYRLSFLYGNFTTLTRFTEADLERVITEQLSPLYVSIHATDPELRAAPAAQPPRRHQPALARARCSTPASRCTARSSCARASTTATRSTTRCSACSTGSRALATVGVVPLGVSDHTTEPEMRPHTRAEAERVIDIVERVAGALPRRARPPPRVRVRRVLPPRRPPVPRARRRTTGSPQHENGIGMATQFAARGAGRARRRRRRRRTAPAPGSSPGSTARPPRATARPALDTAVAVPASATPTAAPIAILTGEYGARVLAPLSPTTSPPRPACRVRVLPVENRFFGGNIARHRSAHRARRRPRARRHRPGGRALPAPRRRALERPLPRRHHARRPPAPGRDRRHRRRVARAGGAVVNAAAPRRRRRRPAERRASRRW